MNIINHLLTGLNQNGALSGIRTTAFQPGQILNGKIVKLFPNGIASLQVGSQKIVAQLEASLEANQRYWFQVQPGEGKVRLKVLASMAQHARSTDTIASLVKELHIPHTAENLKITTYLLKEQLPVNKDLVEQTARWLKESPTVEAGLEAVKQMVKRELPMSKAAFQAIAAAVIPDSLTESIETLGSLLQKEPLSKSGQQLAAIIKQLFDNEEYPVVSSAPNAEIAAGGQSQKMPNDSPLMTTSSFVNHIKELVNRLGYTYEHEIGKFLQGISDNPSNSDALKPLLLDFIMEEQAGLVRDKAETILHKITGLQLLAQDFAPIEQFALQIPLPLMHKTVDLTMQWSGRKCGNGQIDSAFCRIIFYLELEHLHDTMVDMQVQNRIITLTIVNEFEDLKQIAAPYIDILKGNLEELSFTLSSVHFVKHSEHKIKKETQALSPYLTSRYSGVDIRI